MAIEATKFHNAALNHARFTKDQFLQDLSVAQWDYYFNSARAYIVETLAAKDEINSIASNKIRPLKVRKYDTNLDTQYDDCVIAEYPSNYYRLVRQSAIIESDCCPNQQRRAIVRVFSSDEIEEARKSTNWKPSWEYEETFAVHNPKGLMVYHDGAFDIKKVEIDYIRMPSEIRAPSLAKAERYIDETGKPVTQDSAFDVDDPVLWRDIVDIAVLMALRDDNKVQNFKTQAETILFKKSVNTN